MQTKHHKDFPFDLELKQAHNFHV